MLIRAAVPQDIPQIMTLAGSSETAAHWSAREYDALFAPEAPERAALVAYEREDAIAGFVVARCGEEWELENVVVDPMFRRRGIGRALIEELMRRARQGGAKDVFLEVRESNAAARALYGKMGFREEGRRPRYYAQPEEDALLLRLVL
ncbi:MAG TPA: ribosomal protein S18-alanine N-acetyltransferase [Verrucomicrobiae bacterium]|nr:ribosomal protein S18-alanine N-acetyltransferase [Verrucomicrobiae bacterium]